MNPTISPTNTPQPQIQPNPVPSAAVSDVQKAGKNAYETAMLIFGGLTIFSLVTNNGWLVKISVMVFLGVAIISIVNSLNKSKEAKQVIVSSNPATITPVKKPMTVMRLLGIIMLVIIGLPIIGYGVMFIFLIVALSTGGVHAT